MTSSNSLNKKSFTSKSKISYEISEKLHKMAFKKEIIAELLHLYYDAKFMEKLDENRYLIGFDNGVYDLKSLYFRNGRPEDYISMNTKCDFVEYNPNDIKIQQVEHFFDDIQPDPIMKNYLLTKLSSFLEGVQRDQRFEIWIGTGANGKGRILKLILDSFGDYACTIPVTLLTKPRGDSNSASPALANTKGKRCCIFQEPENNDKIYVGHMKNITGGDKMMARSLYCDPVEFYPQFKTILACNKLPEVPSADGGTWRRIRVVPFETSFVIDPKEPNERKLINNLDDLIAEWTSSFMSMLIEKYKIYIKHGIDEPKQVLLQTNQYKLNSDIYSEFVNDMIFNTDGKEFLLLEDVVIEFNKWYKDSGHTEKRPVRNDLKNEMEKRMGKPIKNKYIGFRFRTPNDVDENEKEKEDINATELNTTYEGQTVTVPTNGANKTTPQKFGQKQVVNASEQQELTQNNNLNNVNEIHMTSNQTNIIPTRTQSPLENPVHPTEQIAKTLKNPEGIDNNINTDEDSFETLFIKSKTVNEQKCNIKVNNDTSVVKIKKSRQKNNNLSLQGQVVNAIEQRELVGVSNMNEIQGEKGCTQPFSNYESKHNSRTQEVK